MSRALSAEWTKLRTVPSTAWLALATAALTVALGAAMSSSVDAESCPAPAGCELDTTRLTLTGVWLGQAAVAVLAVLAVTSEYETGMIQATLTAIPRRGLVLASKATVVAATVAAAGTLGVLGSLAAGRAILSSNGFTAANGHPLPSPAAAATLRAAAGTVLYLGLVALLSLGVATIVRDTAGALVAVLTLLYSFPVVTAFVADPIWQARLQKLAPMTAGLAIQATRDLDLLPIAPWAGLAVLGSWTAAALLAAAIVLTTRDA